MSRDPAQARKELDELSEVFPLDDGDGSEDEGAADAEEDERRDAPKTRWGTVDGCTPNERFFARMQGATPGERMTTAVKTQAEKDKFDREVFQFLVSPEVRQQVAGHRRGTQSINFDAFAAKWNEDVGEIERNEVAGRLEVSGDANKKINRKAPFDLQSWWTESRKEVNTARTVEQNKDRLSAMYEKNRVRLSEPSTAERAAVGMTITGQTFSFPLVHNGRSTLPRPAPSATGGPEHDERDERGSEPAQKTREAAARQVLLGGVAL
ncbi:unnamed protein product [Ectocarpus sp. 6 AP-2014]